MNVVKVCRHNLPHQIARRRKVTDLIKQFCESTADKVVKIYDNTNSESEFIRIDQEKYNYLLNSKPNQMDAYDSTW